MTGRRTSKRASMSQAVSVENEFVSADKFNFELEIGSPKGAITRGRRSSMQLTKAPVQAAARGRKRMSMMPTVEEKAVKQPKRRSIAVPTKPAAKKTLTKGIEIKNFYTSPEKKPSKRRSAIPAPSKASMNLKEFVASPKKVARKSFMSDEAIIESLEEMFDKTPTDGKRPPKTFETEAPEKAKPRRATIQLKSPIVMVSKKSAKIPTPSRTPSKTPTKAKTPESKTPVRAPSRSTRQTPGRVSKSTRKTPKKPKDTTIAEANESSTQSPNVHGIPVKKTDKTPAKKLAKTPRASAKTIAKANESSAKSPNVKETPIKKTEKTPAKNLAKTPRGSAKTIAKANESSAKSPNVKETPAKKTEKTPAKKLAKTPGNEPRSVRVNLKRKNAGDESATPAKRMKVDASPSVSEPAKKTPVPKKTPARKAAPSKATPVTTKIISKKTVVLRKTGSKPVSTPVQINPANLLRKNMKVKVETAIVSKIASRPATSPYLLVNQDENSPKFEKMSTKVEEVKTHITGTPAVNRRTRRFGTTIQPSLLALDSPVPQTERRTVQSSTPVRGKKRPLPDMVEATPIRAPVLSSAPASPPPEMVTGKLANMCVIM